jgi:hypothetical protein
MSFRDRIEALFAKYNPEKLGSVGKLLDKYAGREEQVIEALVHKYGPEPPLVSQRPQRPARPDAIAGPVELEPEVDEAFSVDDKPESPMQRVS